jgi:aquaporin Z
LTYIDKNTVRYYPQDMKNYIIEFIGTFFLVLTVALTGNPIAIGAVLMVMVYMGGYISGGHYNPAVTLAVFLSKKISAYAAVRYMASQIAGGFVAAFVYSLIKSSFFMPAPGAGVTNLSAYLIEILFTFALASVVLHTAVSKKVDGNDYFGLAIGSTVMVGAFAGGTISGAVFNPAVALGPMLFNFGSINTAHLILYLVGPLIGGALASVFYKHTAS